MPSKGEDARFGYAMDARRAGGAKDQAPARPVEPVRPEDLSPEKQRAYELVTGQPIGSLPNAPAQAQAEPEASPEPAPRRRRRRRAEDLGAARRSGEWAALVADIRYRDAKPSSGDFDDWFSDAVKMMSDEQLEALRFLLTEED